MTKTPQGLPQETLRIERDGSVYHRNCLIGRDPDVGSVASPSGVTRHYGKVKLFGPAATSAAYKTAAKQAAALRPVVEIASGCLRAAERRTLMTRLTAWAKLHLSARQKIIADIRKGLPSRLGEWED